MPSGLNDTTITLIPKVRNPQKIAQYRPISLCPVMYKIAVKVVANRLCLILDEVIGEEQSAFVLGCLITDNVLVTYESIHAIRRRDTSPTYLLFQTLLPLFWTLTCMI